MNELTSLSPGVRDDSKSGTKTRCCILAFIVITLGLAVTFLGLWLNHVGCDDHKSSGSQQSPRCDFSFIKDQEVQDVIIVEGGPAGVFVGDRLRTTLPDKTVLLLEATNRIGGRLHSESLDGIDFPKAELGGMRYINVSGNRNESHIYIMKVIEELGIAHEDFYMDENNPSRPYRLRDYFVQQEDLKKAGKKAYRLNTKEQNKTPNQVFDLVVNDTVSGLPGPEELENSPYDITTVDGYRLIDLGSINIYNLANASDDAHNYVVDGRGYSMSYSNLNAATSIAINRDTSLGGNKYRTPREGMAEIPKRLKDRFETKGGIVHMNTTVTKIDECTLNNTEATKVYFLTTYNYSTNKTNFYFARRVVLALTRTQLKRIHWDALWTSEKRHLLDSVISFEAVKIFLAFEEPWWRKDSLRHLNLTGGRTISSFPSRQTYYFGPRNPQVSNRSFTMFYNDGQYAKFWKALVSSKIKKVTSKFDGFKTSSSAIFPMSELLLTEAIRELAINHNTSEDVIGKPYFGWTMVWDPDQVPGYVEGYGPYIPSEGWALWAPGVNYTQATYEVMQLNKDQEIFICGSVFSPEQAWAEGALMHADDMLEKHFKVPSYIPKDVKQERLAHIRNRRFAPFP